MGLLFKRYKTKFRYSLQPVFAMLVAKRRDLHDGEWKLVFEKMKVSITSNPEEYLGAELPDHLLLRDILDEIFFEFVKEINYHEATSEHRLLNRRPSFL